jgi:hypothetical protein
VFVVSDGVHDNCDPQLIGKLPSDLNIKSPTWELAQQEFPEEAELAKTIYRQNVLEEIISSIANEEEVTPKIVTRKLIKYCRDLTNAGRLWMEQNPKKQLPHDYVLYPGKMDHTTCVSIRVGRIE